MLPKVQPDVADVNHVEHNNTDQPFDAFNDWSTSAQVTSKELKTVYTEEQDRRRRSDSFGDEWQDYTSEVSVNNLQVIPQHKPLELYGSTHTDTVDFVSQSEKVFTQCFHSSNCDNSLTHTGKFDPHNDP